MKVMQGNVSCGMSDVRKPRANRWQDASPFLDYQWGRSKTFPHFKSIISDSWFKSDY